MPRVDVCASHVAVDDEAADDARADAAPPARIEAAAARARRGASNASGMGVPRRGKVRRVCARGEWGVVGVAGEGGDQRWNVDKGRGTGTCRAPCPKSIIGEMGVTGSGIVSNGFINGILALFARSRPFRTRFTF